MKRIKMMIRERRLASFIRSAGKKLRAHVAGLMLPLLLLAGAAPASAAEYGHPSHLHRAYAPQSAGTAETRGKILPSAPKHGAGSRRSADRAEEKKQDKGRSSRSARGNASARGGEKTEAAPSKARGRSRRRKNPPPMDVDDQITMSRASARRVTRKTNEQRAAQSAPPAEQVAGIKTRQPLPAMAPTTEKKPLTVEDFVRAAGGGTVATQAVSSAVPTPAPAPAEVLVRGESHPDENERITTTDEPAELPKAKLAVATQKPAPIVRSAPEPKSVVTPANVAAGVSYDDAPRVEAAPQPRMVQGFGGEVDLLPSNAGASVKAANSRKELTTKTDALSADDRPLQREMIDDAVKPMVVPLYTRSGHLIVPPPLKGTHEILVHQNTMADDEGLSRIQDDEDLNRMREAHLLVSFPDIAALEVNEDLPMNRRYARPWTVKFAVDTARAFYAKFHEPLRLNSAVRTVDYQLRLRRVNGNAAEVEGATASPHLTGQAIDFGKRGMSMAELAWMRAYLLPLMQAGKVDVEEEFQQSCFHISVYGSYGPKKRGAPKTEVAALRGEPAGR